MNNDQSQSKHFMSQQLLSSGGSSQFEHLISSEEDSEERRMSEAMQDKFRQYCSKMLQDDQVR